MSDTSERARERENRRIQAIGIAVEAAGKREAAERHEKIREANDPEAWADLQNDPQYHSLLDELQQVQDSQSRAEIEKRILERCKYHGAHLSAPITGDENRQANKVVADLFGGRIADPDSQPTDVQLEKLLRLQAAGLSKTFPTIKAMAEFLGISRDTIYKRAKNNARWKTAIDTKTLTNDLIPPVK